MIDRQILVYVVGMRKNGLKQPKMANFRPKRPIIALVWSRRLIGRPILCLGIDFQVEIRKYMIGIQKEGRFSSQREWTPLATNVWTLQKINTSPNILNIVHFARETEYVWGWCYQYFSCYHLKFYLSLFLFRYLSSWLTATQHKWFIWCKSIKLN